MDSCPLEGGAPSPPFRMFGADGAPFGKLSALSLPKGSAPRIHSSGRLHRCCNRASDARRACGFDEVTGAWYPKPEDAEGPNAANSGRAGMYSPNYYVASRKELRRLI